MVISHSHSSKTWFRAMYDASSEWKVMERSTLVPYFVVLQICSKLWCGPTVKRHKQHLCLWIFNESTSQCSNEFWGYVMKILLTTEFVVLQRFRTVKSISTTTDNSPWAGYQSIKSPYPSQITMAAVTKSEEAVHYSVYRAAPGSVPRWHHHHSLSLSSTQNDFGVHIFPLSNVTH